jgi:tRNA-specific 2-thiouridylase
MSGGVDSSVAAALLLREGYDVVGVFMRLGSPGEALDRLAPAEEACDPARVRIGKQGCCSIEDAADARAVAARLGIPFYVCNFKKDFGRIIDYFSSEYLAGRTPNPCVRCNDWLKFGKLHDYARQVGATHVASGHYARLDRDHPAGPRLRRGLDQGKDQSYVLFGVPRERLGSMLLPVGGLTKAEVRRIAREMDLPVFDKPDSQEICFVPDNDYASLVERHAGVEPAEGAILDRDGARVGTHAGHHRFTIGQRRGVGVALGYPIYVTHKDPASNTITVGTEADLMSGACVAGEANWLSPAPLPGEWIRVRAQHRYNAEPVPAEARIVDPLPDDAGTPSGRRGRFEVRFEAPERAVTPGQAIVLYDDDDAVLAGGWIESAAR